MCLNKKNPMTKIMIRAAAADTKMAAYIGPEGGWGVVSVKISVNSDLFNKRN